MVSASLENDFRRANPYLVYVVKVKIPSLRNHLGELNWVQSGHVRAQMETGVQKPKHSKYAGEAAHSGDARHYLRPDRRKEEKRLLSWVTG